MDRKDWIYSSSCLRGILRNLESGDFRRRVKYRFGMQFNPMFGFYHLWDGREDKTIATVRLRPKHFILRYDNDSIFKNEMLKFGLSERRGRFITSTNITRHDEWARYMVARRVNEAIKRRENFLAEERRQTQVGGLPSVTTRLIVSGPLRMHENSSPTMTEQLQETSVTVTFPSHVELDMYGTSIGQRVSRLVRPGWVRFDRNVTISHNDLLRLERQCGIPELRHPGSVVDRDAFEAFRSMASVWSTDDVQEFSQEYDTTDGRVSGVEQFLQEVSERQGRRRIFNHPSVEEINPMEDTFIDPRGGTTISVPRIREIGPSDV